MPDLISKVKELYAAFGSGDISTIIASVADDVSWEVEGPAEILASGIRRSPKEVVEYFAALAEQGSEPKLEMTELFQNGDAVAAFGRFQMTIKSTGIRIDTPVAQYLKFHDGKIVRQVLVTNTAASLEAIRGHSAGATA